MKGKEVETSVVLSTYNGEKYVIEQLESIYNQTKKVDEVIIKDDCSDDDTVNLVKKFIEQRHLSNWKVVVNCQNLGWKKNFVEGLYLTHGQFIFFCDQDDIWHEDKVEKMVGLMKNNPRILLLTSDYDILRMENDKSYVKKKAGNSALLERYVPKGNVISVHYPGCTYCISVRMIPLYKKYWKEIIPHDAFAWSIANIFGRLFILHEELITYRRHSNTVTGRSIENREQRIAHLRSFRTLITMYRFLILGMKKPVLKIEEINKIEKWNKNRYAVIMERKMVAALSNLFYIKYYNSVAQYIMDIVYSISEV